MKQDSNIGQSDKQVSMGLSISKGSILNSRRCRIKKNNNL